MLKLFRKQEPVVILMKNCETIEIKNPEDFYMQFDIDGGFIECGTKNINIGNVVLRIKKDAKAKVQAWDTNNWQERIKKPDIDSILFKGELYQIRNYGDDFPDAGLKITETDIEYIIHL